MIRIPVRIVSEMNTRGHWRKRHTRKKGQQYVAEMILRHSPLPGSLAGRIIRLTRIYPTKGRCAGKRMDSDNLAGAMKNVQDAVSSWLGIDDGLLQWDYQQEPGDDHFVVVEIVPTPESVNEPHGNPVHPGVCRDTGV